MEKLIPKPFPEPWASDWGQDINGLWMAFRYKGVRQPFRWIIWENINLGTNCFWLSETTNTYTLWQAVMGNEATSPIVKINEFRIFIDKLNESIPGLKVHRPTELQLDYAMHVGEVKFIDSPLLLAIG